MSFWAEPIRMPWGKTAKYVAAGLALAVWLIDRHLALLAALSLAALFIGAGRGALAATVELPAQLVGQSVSVSGIVDDDPVERKANPEPRRQYMATLHPAKAPGDCSQISEPLALAPPRRPRSNPGVLQFLNRSCFFKVRDYVRVIGDPLSIK